MKWLKKITLNLLAKKEVNKLKMAKKEYVSISKAYDQVEWNFLESKMFKLGFNSKWVSIIMNCVTCVSYSLILNDCVFDPFIQKMASVKGSLFTLFVFDIHKKGYQLYSYKTRGTRCYMGYRQVEMAPRTLIFRWW